MNKSLSIVIPVLNNWSYTNYVLTNLISLNDEKYEIIIVDNGSNDLTEEGMKKYQLSNVKYIRNKSNLGFGFASNQGFAISSGDIVMFLNNDIKINDKSLKWLDEFIDTVNIIETPVLIGPTGGLVDDNFNFKYETSNPKDKINYMSGWCLSAKKEVWNKLILNNQKGPFDSNSFFAYFEDTDVGFRCVQHKISFLIYPLPITHIGKQTSSKVLNVGKLYSESRVKFIEKWRNSATNNHNK